MKDLFPNKRFVFKKIDGVEYISRDAYEFMLRFMLRETKQQFKEAIDKVYNKIINKKIRIKIKGELG
jgi:hypothetical protein